MIKNTEINYMSINQPMNKEVNESLSGWQVYLLWFITLIAIALLVLPILPALMANVSYSFSGEAPKIYWYLSRASGIVSFTILWISMALGLGITNKMARLWPGAPSAFAIHQYTSLLGLAFAIYHGLVLMGDHFVDFSLPRLLIPFSISYETFWVGLGQVCFYIWLLVVMSFYLRQRIGQKTWRLIHYVNFVIYVMAFLHGVRSGTDSDIQFVAWFFWISGASLVLLLAYRIYELSLKRRIAIPAFTTTPVQGIALEIKDMFLEWGMASIALKELVVTRAKNLPLLSNRSQVKKPDEKPGEEHKIERTTTDIPEADSELRESGMRKTVNGSVVTLEGTYKGTPIRVRIFGELSQQKDPESMENDEINRSD